MKHPQCLTLSKQPTVVAVDYWRMRCLVCKCRTNLRNRETVRRTPARDAICANVFVRMLREDDVPNMMFLTFLFSDQTIAITFLKDVVLLRCKVQCNSG